MWSSMNATDAWQPRQSRISLWDELKESPCLSCKHRHEDKNKCHLLPTCPINIPTLLGVQPQPYREKENPNWTNKCIFPIDGVPCGKLCPGDYCRGKKGHAHLVARRKNLYPDMPIEFYHMPPGPIGHNDSLLKKWERVKEGS